MAQKELEFDGSFDCLDDDNGCLIIDIEGYLKSYFKDKVSGDTITIKLVRSLGDEQWH